MPLGGHDVADLVRTTEKVQEADCHDNIFFIFAHDDNMKDVIEFFPRDINQWKDKGLDQTVRWKFLKDFAEALNLRS